MVAGAWLKSFSTLSRSPSENTAVTPNPFIERTSQRLLRPFPPPLTPHVRRQLLPIIINSVVTHHERH